MRFCGALLLLAVSFLSAQTAGGLSTKLAEFDTALFDAYNRCELEKFATFFTAGVEFYHDQAPPTYGTEKLLEALKKNICGKVRRELIAGSLRAYPLKDFGAVQMGDHLFFQPARSNEKPTGQAKFIHMWQEKDGVWKISRVISYDHVALMKD